MISAESPPQPEHTMDSNSAPPPPSSQSRPRVQSHKPRSICRNFIYHGVCRDTTCPRAHVPHSDMLDLVDYLMERNDFPPELRSVKQRLTPPNPVSVSREWFFFFFFFCYSHNWNRVCAGGSSRPIEYAAILFLALVRCARDACARISPSPTFTVPCCSLQSHSAPNHTEPT
ncbi:hypothetical protein EDB89DRAFT_125920 [Lactarius sanguifluus]|nr:hypothetical protein EDB89DRAFT_125920 [Lactarius sanguifluus]